MEISVEKYAGKNFYRGQHCFEKIWYKYSFNINFSYIELIKLIITHFKISYRIILSFILDESNEANE